MWQGIEWVTSPLKLIAFAVAILAWLYRERMRMLFAKFMALPDGDRRRAFLAEKNIYGIDGSALPADKQVEIVAHEFASRDRRVTYFYRTAWVVVAGLLIALVVTQVVPLFEGASLRSSAETQRDTAAKPSNSIQEGKAKYVYVTPSTDAAHDANDANLLIISAVHCLEENLGNRGAVIVSSSQASLIISLSFARLEAMPDQSDGTIRSNAEVTLAANLSWPGSPRQANHLEIGNAIAQDKYPAEEDATKRACHKLAKDIVASDFQ